jgi:hypothetical protein
MKNCAFRILSEIPEGNSLQTVTPYPSGFTGLLHVLSRSHPVSSANGLQFAQ